jgi:hypothetical protein
MRCYSFGDCTGQKPGSHLRLALLAGDQADHTAEKAARQQEGDRKTEGDRYETDYAIHTFNIPY